MPADPITATPAQDNGRPWIECPEFWSFFIRLVAHADGPPEIADLIRSLSDASGTPPEAVVAKMKTHLLLGHSKAMH